MSVTSIASRGILLLALAACAGGEPSGSRSVAAGTTPILPDTQTVDGVLVMRHGADAFARAPQWVLDSVPEVVIDGGDAFDLTHVYMVAPLADGRFVVGRRVNGALMMLFAADGTPERVLARQGQGPGEVMAPREPITLPGDTVLVVDENNRSVNWYDPNAGLLRTAPAPAAGRLSCFGGSGRLSSGRQVGLAACAGPTGQVTTDAAVVTFTPDGGELDTVATAAGIRMVMVEMRQGSARFETPHLLRLGQVSSVAAVDSTIVVADGIGGYVLRLLAPDGAPRGRIDVQLPPRPVTDDMREVVIAEELQVIEEQSESERRAIVIEEARRLAREVPFADTLPPYLRVFAGADGMFWVVDQEPPGSTTWSATALRPDGVIVARLTGPRRGEGRWDGPIRFERDRVIAREVDGDGVVRFGVYRFTGPGT